jgi:hypothetical protein
MLRRKIETAKAGIESASRAKAAAEDYRARLVNERARIAGRVDIEKGLIIADSLGPIVDALLVDGAALEERFRGSRRPSRASAIYLAG